MRYNSVTRRLEGREKKTESVVLPTSEKTAETVSRDYNFVTRRLEGREPMELSEVEAQLKKAIRDYNRRAKSQHYQTWTFEEVLDLIAHEKAVICSSCGMLILAGKHKTYYYNFERHLGFNVNCLRIRLSQSLPSTESTRYLLELIEFSLKLDNPNKAVQSSPVKENDPSSV